jgi:hypothetical protein
MIEGDELSPETDARIEAMVGSWEYDGDRFTVTRSPEGGLLATMDRDGSPVSPAWVIMRGRMVDEAPDSSVTAPPESPPENS